MRDCAEPARSVPYHSR